MNTTVATSNNSFTASLQDLIEYPTSGILSKVLLKDNNSHFDQKRFTKYIKKAIALREELKALIQQATDTPITWSEISNYEPDYNESLVEQGQNYNLELIEQLLSKRGCQIVVANAESLSPQAELLEDLMAVVHCFSCRLYGTRSYRKEKEKAIKEILNIPNETLLKFHNKIQC